VAVAWSSDDEAARFVDDVMFAHNVPCLLACFLPHYWGSQIISCTSSLHCCLSLANLEHSATDLFDQSLISSVHLRIGLPRLLFPSILPSSISVDRFLALTTWPKYWSLRLCTVASSHSWGCISCSTDVLVRCVVQLTLNNRRYAVISKPRIRLTSTAFSLQVSHPYSATVHTKVDKSLLTLTCKDLSFHKESRDLTAPLAAPSLACISLLQSPFSVIIAPRYLNVSTCSSSLPLDTFYSFSSFLYHSSFNQIYFVTQNYTIPIKDGKTEQCVNRTQRQLRATLTGAQTDIYGKS